MSPPIQALLAWIELLVGDRFLFLYWMHTLIWYSITLGQNWLIDPNLSKIWSKLGCVHTQMTQRNWTMSIVESPAASGWPQMPQFGPPVLLSSRRPPWNRRHRRFNKNTHTHTQKTNVTLSNIAGRSKFEKHPQSKSAVWVWKSILYCFGCSRTSASVIRTSVSHQSSVLLGSLAPLNICTFPQEKPGTSRWVTSQAGANLFHWIPNSLSSIIPFIQLLKDNARPNHMSALVPPSSPTFI